ncbi:MAG: PatB family C-S lyase [Tannerellaceae bacterium]|nr:PatB family C-S lyase [Tannerellaceae bacterium]
MYAYNFDEIIDRHNTNCLKVDLLDERFGSADLIPLWVADMDFRTPKFIVDAIKERCRHEVFGYTFAPDAYYQSILAWLHQKHQWEARKEWISYIPGIVKGIAFALDCFTLPGDKVIIQPPVYHPFRLVPEMQHRQVVDNPLKWVDGVYQMDFEHLESVIDPQCKVFILCSPHNPGGIVWDKETLVRLADICARHHILVISDEIHAEMTYPGHTHHPFPTVSDAASSCSLTFLAPSKTFNIAGIVTSYAVIPDPHIRHKFFAFLRARELDEGTIFAYEATTAAYTHGAKWLQQMLRYVMENVAFVTHYLKEELPAIKVYQPQASFLIWLDCRELGLKQKDLVALFKDQAGLALNNGTMFGAAGEGYMRLNAGCPRAILKQALEQLKTACRRSFPQQ